MAFRFVPGFAVSAEAWLQQRLEVSRRLLFAAVLVAFSLPAQSQTYPPDEEWLQQAFDGFVVNCTFGDTSPFLGYFPWQESCLVATRCACSNPQSQYYYPCTSEFFYDQFAEGIACNEFFTAAEPQERGTARTGPTPSSPAQAVGMAADGSAVLVRTGGDIDGTGIVAQRFDSAGVATGPAFTVNQLTSGFQRDPSVAVQPDGSFIVAWTSEFSLGGDLSGTSIQMRRFAPDASPLGNQVQVNTIEGEDQFQPAVSVNGSGQFVVAWTSDPISSLSRGATGFDDSGSTIRSQSFTSAGARNGLEVQVNSSKAGYQQFPRVAVATDGTYLVVWETESGATGPYDLNVQGQLFATDSSTIGVELQLNTITGGLQQAPDAAWVPKSNAFQVVWQSTGSYGSDASTPTTYSIQSRSVSLGGVLGPAELQVNEETERHQSFPSIDADPAGFAIVTWLTYGASTTDVGNVRGGDDGASVLRGLADPASAEIRWRRIGLDGTPQDVERPAVFVADGVLWPAVAVGPEGVYYGTAKGLTIYRPEMDRPLALAPPVVVRNADYHETGSSNEFTAEYAALSFANEKDIRYRTRLVGFDSEWSRERADTKIRYTNLPAVFFSRRYTLEVVGRGYSGEWAAEPARFAFVVQPPTWLRWWAFLGYALVLAASLYGVDRYQRKRVLAREREAARIREAELQAETADLIVREMERGGGLITLEDLRRYEAVERLPIKGHFRGHRVIGMPPPSSGGTAVVQMLNVLEGYDLARMGHNTGPYLHHLAEAMRLAFRDRARHLADTDFVDVPVERLTSERYAAELRAGIDWSASPSSVEDVALVPAEGPSTTHYSVVDRAGLAVATTYTLEQSYGSGITVPGAGFLLNNEMGDFNPALGLTTRSGLIGTAPNLAEPGKRMLSSMSPVILESPDGSLFAVTGSPGGRTIINTVRVPIIPPPSNPPTPIMISGTARRHSRTASAMADACTLSFRQPKAPFLGAERAADRGPCGPRLSRAARAIR